jgi:hypothetical protein
VASGGWRVVVREGERKSKSGKRKAEKRGSEWRVTGDA